MLRLNEAIHRATQNIGSDFGGLVSGNDAQMAYFLDGVNDYISGNTVIGRTGYDVNVVGNVSTGSDADGDYIRFNGNKDQTTGTGSLAYLDGGTTPLFDQTTSFFIAGKFKINTLPPNNGSGIFGSNFDAGFYTDPTGNDLFYGLRGSSQVINAASGAFSLGTAFWLHLVYDAAVQKFYFYVGGVLINAGGTAAPATFSTNDWYLGDNAVVGGNISSCDKQVYQAYIGNYAPTAAEVLADIALGNAKRNDARIVAYYIPENLQYNTQHAQQVAFSNAAYTKGSGTTPTDAVDTIYGVTADQIAWTGTSIAVSSVTQNITTISGAAMASKTWKVKVRVKVASGTALFKIRCTHLGVADYYSGDLTATVDPQEFTFTQTFTSSTSGTAIQIGIVCDSGNSAATLIVSRKVDLWLVDQTLFDESPNIGGYIGWKTPHAIGMRIKPGADGINSSNSQPLFLTPWMYIHIRDTFNQLNFRFDSSRVPAGSASASYSLGSSFRNEVYVMGVFIFNAGVRTLKIYTGGILRGSATITNQPPTTFISTVAWLGRKSSNYYSGYARKPDIFLGNFSDADVITAMNGLTPVGTTKVQGRGPEPNESGLTALDTSGNNRIGTLNGGVLRKAIF